MNINQVSISFRNYIRNEGSPPVKGITSMAFSLMIIFKKIPSLLVIFINCIYQPFS